MYKALWEKREGEHSSLYGSWGNFSQRYLREEKGEFSRPGVQYKQRQRHGTIRNMFSFFWNVMHKGGSGE